MTYSSIGGGRTVLVTGGARGMGAAIVDRLSSDGWHVHAPSRAELDLADSASVQVFLRETPIDFDGLVLNAGINDPQPIIEMSETVLNQILDVNLRSSIQLIQRIAPAMAQRGFGRIVGVSSLYSQRSREGRVAYSISKAGLEALLRSVTVEYAGRGVLANSIAPGFVDTELTRRNNPPDALQSLIARIPVGRLARVDEVAGAVSFLMSPSNTYITGQVLGIDGGWAVT